MDSLHGRGRRLSQSIKPRDAVVRLRKGLFVFVDLPADVLGELLKDRVLSTQRVPWEQSAYQNGEEYPCHEQANS